MAHGVQMLQERKHLASRATPLTRDTSGRFRVGICSRPSLLCILLCMRKRWDVFISYAHEDRVFVEKLSDSLSAYGLAVWFDGTALKIGDSLTASIQRGLTESRFGIVVISNNFVAKRWPQMELGALIALETTGANRILPVWHSISAEEVRKNAPLLADRLAASSKAPFGKLIDDLLGVIAKRSKWQPWKLRWPDGGNVVVIPLRNDIDHAYVVGESPVSNAQYRRCVEAGIVRPPAGQVFDRNRGGWCGPFEPWTDQSFSADDQPVVCVSFDEARAYCRWLSPILGVGAAFVPDAALWRYAAFASALAKEPPIEWRDTQPRVHHNETAPAHGNTVGDRSNVWGIGDMFGNVWEWCSDPDREAFFLGPPPSRASVQGGGFLDLMIDAATPRLTAAELTEGTYTRHADLGFRVAGIVPIRTLPSSVARNLAAAPNTETRRR
jgi:hypothetical protein